MLDIIKDTLLDGIELLPFLFIAFFIIELIEHKLSNKGKKVLSTKGKLAPLVGSLFGLIPQCGFSVLATNLYVTRIISLGTLISIYLTTSDEMLPILLGEQVSWKIILMILGIKFVVGLICGYGIDFILRNKNKVRVNYDICSDEHCGCNHGHSILKSSLIHTFKTFIFLIIITFVINIAFEYVGSPILAKIFLKDSFLGPFVTSLIGLIPTCGASIMITELYLNGAISLASAMAGLLTGSGVAILVLFKSNKNLKENLMILGIVYGLGVFFGIIIQLLINIF